MHDSLMKKLIMKLIWHTGHLAYYTSIVLDIFMAISPTLYNKEKHTKNSVSVGDQRS